MNFPRALFLLTGGLAFAVTSQAQTSEAATEPTPATPVEQTTPAAPASVAVNNLQVGTGFDYSRGAYGFTEDTEVYSVPLLLTYSIEKWVLRANVPYLTIKGPADAVGTTGISGGGTGTSGSGGVLSGLPGGGSTTTGTTSTAARPTSNSESGIGDVMLGVTRMLGPVLGPVQLDLTARVKLPTADEDKGLGTGETDYYAQADFYYVGERFIPFATLGYRFLTDSDRYALEDGAYASVGSAYRINETTRVGASFDWRERIVEGGDDANEVSVFVAHDFTPRWNLILYALTGFTDASPDFGAGGSVSYRF